MGGAGTIFSKAYNRPVGQVVADNGGQSGTNTAVSVSGPFDLTARNGAIVYPSGGYLTLSNLYVNSGGTLTTLKSQSALAVAGFGNAAISPGGRAAMDWKGLPPRS